MTSTLLKLNLWKQGTTNNIGFTEWKFIYFVGSEIYFYETQGTLNVQFHFSFLLNKLNVLQKQKSNFTLYQLHILLSHCPYLLLNYHLSSFTNQVFQSSTHFPESPSHIWMHLWIKIFTYVKLLLTFQRIFICWHWAMNDFNPCVELKVLNYESIIQTSDFYLQICCRWSRMLPPAPRPILLSLWPQWSGDWLLPVKCPPPAWFRSVWWGTRASCWRCKLNFLWSSGKGQARLGRGWPLRRNALKLKPLPTLKLVATTHPDI